jgi:lipopolysaccharide transport system ATP-binding protein
MSDIAVRVHGLGKQYRLGPRERYKTLRDTMTDAMSAPFRAIVNARRSAASGEPPNDFIWALKDVSLEVEHGEAVGIIGRNGAGKSTLLKILSRITEPTEGYAEIHGRVGALLEVGTGFHPELTGRENIYLNGAILGMKKVEIARKFDEIVAFAEVEKFLDTPVKHYSSGMFVRLAFAVAAHLEPDILLVDEVLAVGDVAFQKKCLGKMQDVAGEGRTVLFVSHNLGSLANLCPRAVLLVQGERQRDGASGDVIAEYVALGSQGHGEAVWNDPASAPGNEKVRLHAVRIISGGEVTADVDIRQDVRVEVEYWNLKSGAHLCTSIHLLDKMGMPVLASANMDSANQTKDEWFNQPHPIGLFRAVCTVPGNFLNEGMYSVNALVVTEVAHIEVFAHEAVSFIVHDTGAMRKEFGGVWIGVVRPKLVWQTQFVQLLDSRSSEEQIR